MYRDEGLAMQSNLSVAVAPEAFRRGLNEKWKIASI
jgi:hypothetical protein